MINFILPNFYQNFSYNQELILNNNYSNIFYGIEGSFCFSIFNGRTNNNISSSFVSYNEIIDSIKNYYEISHNCCIFDFGNTAINENDFVNSFAEVIFTEYANKKNIYFEVSNENFIQYLIKKFPDIQLILHENYTIFHSEEEIQSLLNKYHNIKGINITLLNLCKNIKNCWKIGIVNLDSCYYCPQYPFCLDMEQNNTLEYSIKSSFNECKRKQFLTLDKCIENIKEIINETNFLLFVNLTSIQSNEYMQLIINILEKEQEGVFN